jgi:hypothetical protein
MDDQKKQLIDKLKSTSNILVTVRNNPNVDELSACIGLTLMLNKLGKHATAVFSGEVPDTIDFLKPEETLEKNTDSLRDFIIALDKSKADKLRYKVEDKVVKIFITPYRTSISQDDLEFSQGDFNVDAVVALGAHEQHELDMAITEHTRILHDAVMMSINNTENGSFGSINWVDSRASSLCELVARLNRPLGGKDKNLLDEQVATALLTGIVAETERFSNARTTPDTMSVSSELMSAGANQQLVASELEAAEEAQQSDESNDNDNSGEGSGNQNPSDNTPPEPKPDDGTLEISHDRPEQAPPMDMPLPTPEMPMLPPRPDEGFGGLPQIGPAKATGETLERLKSELPQIRQLHDPNSMLPTIPEEVPSEVRDLTGIPSADAEKPSGMPQGGPASFFSPKPMDPPEDPATRPLLSHEGPAADESKEPAVTSPDAPVEPPLPPAPVDLPPPPAPKFEPYVPKPEPVPAPQPKPEPDPAPKPVLEPAPDPFVPPQPVAPPMPPMPTPAAVQASTPPPQPPLPPAPVAAPAAPAAPVDDGPTLAEIEESVHSSHQATPSTEPQVVSDIDSARNEVLKALEAAPDQTPEPIAALNAQPLGGELHPQTPVAPAPVSEGVGADLQIDADGNIQLPPPPAAVPTTAAAPAMPAIPNMPNITNEPAPSPYSPADQPLDMPLPPGIHVPPPQTAPPTNPQGDKPNAPPPVPPPMMPQYPQ